MKISTGGQNYNIDVGVGLNQNSKAKAKAELNNFIKQAEKTSNVDLNIRINDKGVKSVIRTIRTETGDLVQITSKYNKENQLLNISINKIQRSYNNLSSSINAVKNAQQGLNNTVKHSVSIFDDFAATFMKMAKFNTINLIYDGLISKMSEAIEVTNDFDKAMTEFKKVTDTSNLDLNEYTETLGKLGEATARSATQMLDASTEFSKSGYNAEDSAKLAQIATLYQNIADSELSAGEAASFIISQMKAFGIEAEQATSIIDKVNEVSNNFAVSSTDISSALTKQSASLAAYGNTLDESISLVTAGAEIMTHQSGKVARGLRTIGANITQLAQGANEFEIQVAGATKSIQLWNEAGTDMLNTYQVLEQISEVWDDMTNAEKSNLAITLAKKTQMDTFLAVMGNFQTAEEAYTTALLSEGSALQENAKYMESIEAHQAQLKAQWEQLVLSAPIEDFEKSLLSAGTALLKFANNDIVQLIAKAVALTSAITLSSKALSALYALMKANSGISIFASAITSLIAGEVTLTQVTIGLTTAMLSNPLFMATAVIAGILGIIKLVEHFTVTLEETTDALKKSNEEISETKNKIESLEEQIDKLGKQIDKLNQKKIEITDQKQLESLTKQTNELSRQETILRNQLLLEKQKLEQQERSQAKLAQQAANTKTRVTVYGNNGQENPFQQYGVAGNELFTTVENSYEAGKLLLQGLTDTQKKINECREAMRGLNEESDGYKEQSELVKELNREYDVMLEQLTPILENSDAIIKAGGEEAEKYQEIYDSLAQLNNLKEQSFNGNQIEEETEDLEEYADNVEEIKTAWEEASDILGEIQSAYDVLSKAVQEYNENQGYSVETLAKLNELSPQYLAALVNENGQLTLNVNLLQEEYEAQKQAAIEKINAARYTEIAQLCEERLAEATSGATIKIQESGEEAVNTAEKYNSLANAAHRAAAGMAAVEKGGYDTAEFKKQLAEINKTFDSLVSNVEKSSLQMSKSTAKSAKSAAGSHKDAWVEAFKEEKTALKHLLETDEITEYEYYERLKDLNEKYFGEISGNHEKYIKEYNENEEEIYKGVKAVYDKVRDYLKEAVEQGYEKAINAIKKEEKKVLAEIKKEIDGLKKEKDKVLKGIQDEIDMLKKQKEEVQKYWNDQIDAIKRENEELQEQNQLLEYQQALQQAKAQKVMIYQDGRFQLGENESAVAQAEEALNKYQDQLAYEQQIRQMEELRDTQIETIEERIEALEEYYDYMEDYYDRQIEAMEEYYDQVQEQYEAQIELLQNELDAFKEGFQKQEDLENARLAAQVLGMNERKDLYAQELDNLKNYINEVNRMLLSLGEAGAEVDFSYTPITGYHKGIAEVAAVSASVQARSSGDASFGKDEIALVGESPNAELLLGSKVNTIGGGKLMHLQKGTGVVNAESTATLAGILNGLGNPSNNISNNRTTQQNFTFGNISLPNVTNAESFVETLSREFNNYAIQYGNIRI